MKNQFTEVMANNSNEDLIEIVTTKRADYEPEAVLAAEKELERRNLSPNIVAEAKEKIVQQKLKLSEREKEPLGLLQKILFFIFFWGIFPWLIAATYKADGYKRKYKEAWKSIKFGLITWLIVVGLVLLIVYAVFD